MIEVGQGVEENGLRRLFTDGRKDGVVDSILERSTAFITREIPIEIED